MADDLLYNEAVQLITGTVVAAGTLVFDEIGPMATDVLAKTGIRLLVFPSRDPRS